MKEFDDLTTVLVALFAPTGCPWDREQTFQSMRTAPIEEVYELLEAINLKDFDKVRDELGDLLLVALFFCKLGEKEGKFTTQQVLQGITEKLIRRHPHVFGDVKIDEADQVVSQWEKIKKTEMAHADRKSALDGIPRELSMLPRARKVAAKIIKAGCSLPSAANEADPEMALGERIWELVVEAQHNGLSPEDALQKVLLHKEQAFRSQEKTSCSEPATSL